MAVGGHADNSVDLCGEDIADGKRQYLGNERGLDPPLQGNTV